MTLPLFSLVVTSVTYELNPAFNAVDPKKVIIESNNIAMSTAKIIGLKNAAKGNIAVVIPQHMKLIKIIGFLLPLTSL